MSGSRSAAKGLIASRRRQLKAPECSPRAGMNLKPMEGGDQVNGAGDEPSRLDTTTPPFVPSSPASASWPLNTTSPYSSHTTHGSRWEDMYRLDTTFQFRKAAAGQQHLPDVLINISLQKNRNSPRARESNK